MFSAASRMAFRSAVSHSSNHLRRPVVATVQPMMIRSFAGSTFLNPADVTERIIDVVKNYDKVDATKVSPEAKFSEDLGLDSLDAVEVVMAIEDEFAVEIPDAEADKILSISDATEYIAGHPMAK